MAKRGRAREPIDRAAEYIDSPLMTQRLQYQKRLSVRIAGNYGTYRTHLRLGKNGESNCTCPSEEWPCKHVRALEATWKLNPDSFFDLEDFLDQLEANPKAKLLSLIGEMLLAEPGLLNLCGIEGFENANDEDDFYE